ncbi:MAG: MarR family transcriptional regulator [Gammaproteobacteria bacterium]|jgi:DNA-binding MarR family transcriptional regulator
MDDRIDRLLGQWLVQRPELDCSGLDVVARVQDLAKILRRNENDALEAMGLKMWEYDVLSALRRQGAPFQMPATELARESLLSSGAMTNRIDRLEDRGLVEREPDPDDRRGVLVELTEAGRALVDKAIEARLGVANAQLANLTGRERRAISSGLRKIHLATG